MRIENTRAQLLRTTLLAAIAASPALFEPAFAQAAQERALPSADSPTDSQDVIVITGTLIGRPDIETVSPVTVVDQENLEVRGINTVQDAIQQLASNNGPALVNSFTANGAFAAGASAVSLRALSANSTLVLFDGLRAAYYPLADDGTRNFVDLNTIPDDIVERVEVLRDGASSTYGADAIAGVVNIITRKEFEGLSARIEGGTSQEGDANQSRISLTAGVGDLGADGINAYVSLFSYTSDLLENYQRPFPFNTSNHSTFCYQDQCGPNGVINQIPAAGPFALSPGANFMVRPFDATNTTPVAGSRFQVLNSDCSPGIPATVPPAQQGAVAPSTVCQYDSAMLYGVIQPNVARFGVSGRVTAQLGDFAEAYGQVNFLESTVDYTGFPATVVGTANTGIFFRQFSTSTAGGARDPGSAPLALPIFVCPQRVNCNATNGTLNPNNPFAASGQVARLIGRDMQSVTYDETRSRAYRGAFGIEGTLDNNWSWNVGLTAMHIDLRQINDGYVYIQHLLDVVADGTYNFINPSATPQSVLDYLTPVNITDASSDQLQLQGYVVAPLMNLPGGSLDLAVGASARYEAVDAPSANSDINGPTERYFTPNAFGTQGSRRIYSGFFELNAPVLDQVDVNLAGRFDEYSSGQDAFSPKIGVVFTPIDMLTVRGTYSEGFRIPAFGEANALPTTGFVSNNATLFNDTYLAQYGCSVATFNVCPAYIRAGAFGQTSLARPNLAPEDSKSITVGFVVEPLRDVSFSLDYYDIEKSGAITQPSNAPAIEAYYTGQPIPAGYTVIPDAPDPNNPTATPRIAFVQAQLVNANTIRTSGFDFQAVVERDLFAGVHLSSSLELSYINLLETVFPDGRVERYDGTLGNFTLTSGSGTPKVHGSWVNTFTYGDYDVSAAINLFGGYDLSAMDQGTDYKDCGLSDGSTPCRVADYYTFDLTGRARLTDNLTVYGTIQNVFDELPPYDPVTYGANYYNPVQGGAGILGRYFKFGIKADY